MLKGAVKSREKSDRGCGASPAAPCAIETKRAGFISRRLLVADMLRLGLRHSRGPIVCSSGSLQMPPCLMIQVFSYKNRQPGPKRHDRVHAGQCDHPSGCWMPLIIHPLGELLQNHPWLPDVSRKDIWIQTDQMFGEIDQKESADAHSNG